MSGPEAEWDHAHASLKQGSSGPRCESPWCRRPPESSGCSQGPGEPGRAAGDTGHPVADTSPRSTKVSPSQGTTLSGEGDKYELAPVNARDGRDALTGGGLWGIHVRIPAAHHAAGTQEQHWPGVTRPAGALSVEAVELKDGIGQRNGSLAHPHFFKPKAPLIAHRPAKSSEGGLQSRVQFSCLATPRPPRGFSVSLLVLASPRLAFPTDRASGSVSFLQPREVVPLQVLAVSLTSSPQGECQPLEDRDLVGLVRCCLEGWLVRRWSPRHRGGRVSGSSYSSSLCTSRSRKEDMRAGGGPGCSSPA